MLSNIMKKHPEVTMEAIRFYCSINPWRTDADPFKLIWVNPNKIVKALRTELHAWGKVEGGSWDQNTIQFVERPPNQALKTWVQTGNKQALKDALVDASPNTSNPRYKQGDVNSRIEELKELYESLQESGYKTRKELLIEDPSEYDLIANDPIPPLLDEIIVDIGRHGELIHRYCGQHRLRLAQLLDLNSVAVLVARRHTNWQNLRNEIRKNDGNNPYTIYNHPDLRDIC